MKVTLTGGKWREEFGYYFEMSNKLITLLENFSVRACQKQVHKQAQKTHSRKKDKRGVDTDMLVRISLSVA